VEQVAQVQLPLLLKQPLLLSWRSCQLLLFLLQE
jgi:hypothetical protein